MVMKNVKFNDLVNKELTNVRKKHGPQRNCHEGYAILLEEVDELWEEVRKKQKLRDPKRLLAELVQIGSCAQKMAEDVVIPSLNKKRPN